MVSSRNSEFDLAMYKGDDKILEATVVDHNNNPIPLASATCYLTVKDGFGGNVILSKSTLVPAEAVITNPTAGKVEFYIVPADTAAVAKETSYVYDIKVKLGSGKQHTLFVAALVVKLAVTGAK
jgi:hypothetical protein